MYIKSDRKSQNHILEMLIPFYGVFEPYKISIIPFTAIILSIIALSHYDRKIKVTKQTKPYLIFVGYMTIRDILHMFLSVSDPIGTQVNRLISNVVLYVLIFVVCNNDFDEAILYRWWKIAGVIFGLGMIYHVFQLLVLGQDIYPLSLIPGYDIAHKGVESFTRPTSFFSEPAAYVGSMLPLLFLALKRKDFKWAALSTFLIAVSTSTVGIILVAVLWLVFIISEKKSFKVTVLYSAFVVLFVAMFMYLPIFSDALQKLEDVSEGESTWGSRVKGPFQMIGAMDWDELPFGTSTLDTKTFVYENLDELSKDSGPYIYASKGEDVFLNTFCLIIYRYGILGLLFFLKIFVSQIFDKKYEARMYVIMLLVASFR